jgi:crotonobetainyl-CoA:carnitine CoA-transferase CaiB-like acyl-CoA transferase
MASKTLSGVTVLDLTSYLAGPFGATLLGDLGADVIKIESPDGDMMRHYPSSLAGESRAYVGANRNKRGMVIDMKKPAGQAAFHRLVARADVVIHNFRPGVAERLALDYERLQQLNPRLVYCALTGFGPTGPMAGNPGFDQVLQALSGIASAQGAVEGEPHVVWGSAVDYYSASLLAMAICGALYQREKTGEGQQIDASLLRSALAMQSGRMVWARDEPRQLDRDLKGGRLNGIHPAKQGYIYLQAPTEAFWASLCELTGLSPLAADPRYDSMKKRKEREAELLPLLHEALQQRTALEWEQLFGTRVPCAAVRGIEDMFEHPQVLAQGLVATHDHPTLGSYRAMTGPVRMDGGRADAPDRRSPLLGEHTDEILAESGFTAGEIAQLRAAGAVQ